MNTFRTINNVPDYYINNSRDFQLFCNVLDVVTNGMLVDGENVRNTNNPDTCYGSLLPLMAKKVGIFNLGNTSTYMFRPILQSFVRLRQSKGTRVCLYNLMNVYMRATSNKSPYSITIYNKEGIPENSGIKPYTILIQIQGQVFDTSLLNKLLYYLKPTGYIIQWQFVGAINNIETNIYVESNIEDKVFEDSHNSLLKRSGVDSGDGSVLTDVQHGVDTINLYHKQEGE